MSEQPTGPDTSAEPSDLAEPADSPQRRLVESVAAFEVDPPAPERTRPDGG